MKKYILFLAFILVFPAMIFSQEYQQSSLKMISDNASGELSDILRFEEIAYLKIKFIGEGLKNKSYSITAKEFKEGELVSDTVIIDSKRFPMLAHTVNDTILGFNVIAKQITDNKLKVMFRFDSFFVTRELNLIETKDTYSLRNLAKESKLPIKYDEPFYLLAYILPYDMGNGMKSYCAVGSNGTDAENWGQKFGVKHYILFEMRFESN